MSKKPARTKKTTEISAEKRLQAVQAERINQAYKNRRDPMKLFAKRPAIKE